MGSGTRQSSTAASESHSGSSWWQTFLYSQGVRMSRASARILLLALLVPVVDEDRVRELLMGDSVRRRMKRDSIFDLISCEDLFWGIGSGPRHVGGSITMTTGTVIKCHKKSVTIEGALGACAKDELCLPLWMNLSIFVSLNKKILLHGDECRSAVPPSNGQDPK